MVVLDPYPENYVSFTNFCDSAFTFCLAAYYLRLQLKSVNIAILFVVVHESKDDNKHTEIVNGFEFFWK